MNDVKCSPVETRKNLQVAKVFADRGIDFVCIPATSEDNKNELIQQGNDALQKLIDLTT